MIFRETLLEVRRGERDYELAAITVGFLGRRRAYFSCRLGQNWEWIAPDGRKLGFELSLLAARWAALARASDLGVWTVNSAFNEWSGITSRVKDPVHEIEKRLARSDSEEAPGGEPGAEEPSI